MMSQICHHCSSEELSSELIPYVGLHVICYDCNEEWVE